ATVKQVAADSERVGHGELSDLDGGIVQFLQLGEDLLLESCLDVNDKNARGTSQFLQLVAEHFRRQMLGNVGQPAHVVGEASLDKDAFQFGASTGHTPDFLCRASVRGENDCAVGVLDQITNCRHNMIEQDGSELEPFQFNCLAGVETRQLH